jgi:hypothetical protein
VGARLKSVPALATLLPPALALLLLGAHFWRAGVMPLAAGCVAMLGLLFVRSPWSARALQAVLALGVLEWLRTAWVFATARAAMGQAYGRLLVILGAVAAATLVAALLLRSQAARRHFRNRP